jgi:hypothetical protein
VELPRSTNQWLIAGDVAAIFSPQREALKLDGHGYSPTILHRILHMSGVASSFDVAAEALKVVGEISISDRHINNLAVEIGQQLQEDRDERTKRYVDQPLPRQATEVNPSVDLAAVFLDGGRMRTRQEDQGPGVHQPHWRETKNASFHRMRSRSFNEDPQPDLPDCFRNQAYVEKLIHGLKNLKKEGREEENEGLPDASAPTEHGVCAAPDEQAEWQPETLFRTCLSSLATSDEFGPMMATEADARGFFAAKKKAFLGDGLGYNWTIQQRWFPEFVPIADFVHVVEYVYSAAKAIHDDQLERWQQYVDWATKCWQGRVQEVIDELDVWQRRMGPVRAGEDLPEGHPRRAIHSSLTYFTNNRKRMNYPSYRCRGLPVTSSLAESLVKQVSKRVKGTEMFWNDGPSGEAILQIRSALLCDDKRLAVWLRTRPISPFSPRCRSGTLATTL